MQSKECALRAYLSVLAGGVYTDGLAKTRYFFVDDLKIAACILVVLGHFFMSVVAAGIMPQSALYNVLIQGVYTFHVPLFFVCSGFLYQNSNRVHSLKPYLKNVARKLLDLGVPYFTFSIITFVIKYVFENSVNTKNGDFFNSLFVNPTAPYWYLYALFIFFLIIPCVNSKKQAWLLFSISVLLKILYIACSINSVAMPYVVSSVTGRMIWFAGGMLLSFYIDKLSSLRFLKAAALVAIALGTALSALFYRQTNNSEIVKTAVGVIFTLGCVFAAVSFESAKTRNLSKKLTPYFMPVFLMHTIFAAGVRILLLHFGIDNVFIHILLGVPAGFLFPCAVYKICEKLPAFMFFIYPKKAIDIIRAKKLKK